MMTSLDLNGVATVKIDERYTSQISNEIYHLFSVEDYAGLVKHVSGLNASEYQSIAKKYNRILAGPIATLASSISDQDSIKDLIGASKLMVTTISPFEQFNRPCLRSNSPDFFFRIVRHNQPSDVGLPHFDKQFWELAHGTHAQPGTSFYQKRWKIWIPLAGCDEQNSLRFIAGSHLEDIPVAIDSTFLTQTAYATRASGTPCISPSWVASNRDRFKAFAFQAGTCNLFHDKVVHMGPVNCSTPLRLSAEFTIAVLA